MPSGMFQTWDGVVYLLTTGNGFLAYDLTKGSLLWKVPLINGPARLGNTGPMIAEVDGKPTAFLTYRVVIEGSGTISDRTVMRVASFSLADGAVGWQTDVDDERIPSDSGLGVDKVVAANSDHVVVSTDSHDTGGLGSDFTTVLDARTGKIRWSNPAFQARALDGDTVAGMRSTDYRAKAERATIGLAASDGAQRWIHENTRPSGVLGSGQLGGGLMQVYPVRGNSEGRPAGLIEIKTGREVIRFEPAGTATCRYDGEAVVVCAQHGGRSGETGSMAAYDATSYKLLWQLPDKAAGREAPKLSAARRGAIYGSTSNGPIILDARTGQDKVTDLSFTPDVVIPGFGIVKSLKAIKVHAATG
ncbi:PQQ-like domain-containing protein [Micromonospora nigra]|uniref:PQQ-like domain-containing protein n=2 Tax=Micromonospora nigra TaxID=145857 RepID=A0A1C6RYF0_9ACTN|nr:PQQ-like domain-containing protein [Micromonospora nigra]